MFHKRLLKEFSDNKKMIVGMVFTQWIMLLANVLLMWRTADFVAAAANQSMYVKKAKLLAITLAAVLLIRAIASYINSKLSYETSRQLKERLRQMIFDKLMRLGSGYRDFVKTSEVVQISTEGVEQLEIYFGKYVPQFFYSLLAPVTLFIIVAPMSLKAAVILLICVPMIPMAIIAVQKFAKKMLAKYWGTYTELGDSFLESLQGLTTLKIYQADERYAKKMDDESEKFRKVTMRVLIMQLNSISIMDLVAYGGAGLGIILSLLELRNGNISLAECFFIIMIAAEFFLPMRLLGSFFHISMNGNAAADKIFNLLDLEESEKGAVNSLAQLEGNTVLVSNVTFAYQDLEDNKNVLKNVSLKAEAGLTALVGESGCGKSTIIALIMKELVPQSGIIEVGTKPIGDICEAVLNQKITRIKHDSYIFEGTVRENLQMGNQAANAQEMMKVLKLVHLDELILENGGLDMQLMEKAANISGGQRQRLAVARALLHDSDIYIFDEAASNVDAESENDIMAVIRELAKTKTVILVSHRLANVVAADKIYVIKAGEIIEQGTHEELCNQNGYYEKLYSAQKKLEKYGSEAEVENV